MTVVGSGVTASGSGVGRRARRAADRVPDRLAGAPDVRRCRSRPRPGGPALAPLDVPDAEPVGPIDVLRPAGVRGGRRSAPVDLPSTVAATGSVPVASSVASSVVPSTTTVPGGESSIPDVLRSAPATPLLALIALLTAGVLGAGHAADARARQDADGGLSRGHPRHAATRRGARPGGERVAHAGDPRAGGRRARGRVDAAAGPRRPHRAARGRDIDRARRRLDAAHRGPARRGGPRSAVHAHAGHAGPRHADATRTTTSTRTTTARPTSTATSTRTAAEAGHEHVADDDLDHSHGGIRHSHVPPAGSTISWHSLFVLGLAGGLVPSASALLILLATIAAAGPRGASSWSRRSGSGWRRS